MEAAARLAQVTKEDVVYDVGCGDGRVLIHLASNTDCRHLIGIEIDADRAEEARRNVVTNEMMTNHHKNTSTNSSTTCCITIECKNALHVDYSDATVVFLYLVPRGLRLIKPLLLQQQQPHQMNASDKQTKGQGILRVITYMSPFLDETPVAKELVNVPHQKGAAW
eukprot:CAMPEP_0198294024 /NCGR_PEP_ID=MMETSP1449-20131203/20129_1 /TAXON_ID=420275 /ORGANISM="Attheya septentrionalis, Strain CCMP2084" /LENGTH=165 /DNA_ID=CAMNT_0043993831 /DNA_START=118 /DNA_END=612 /DNA_ORIENTATION=-